MDDQEDNALSIKYLYSIYTRCLSNTAHESGLFRESNKKNAVTLLFDSVTNYHVRDRNVRNVHSYILHEKMCPFPGIKSSFVPFVDVSLLIMQKTSIPHE